MENAEGASDVRMCGRDTREFASISSWLADMNTHLSSDSNGNSSENFEVQASNCSSSGGVSIDQQHKTNSACEVNLKIKTILDQLSSLEDVMMSQEDDDLNVNADCSRMDSEEDEADDEEEEEDDDDDDDDDATLAGYRYCAEETVRFLIQEEHFSPDDPVIIELQLHLEEQQRRLQERIKKQQQQLPVQTTPDNVESCQTHPVD